MFLLNGTVFLRNLIGTRVLWLSGRYGGGKTLLAFALADWLIGNGYCKNCLSNIDHELPRLEAGERPWNTVIVFDESWILLDARDWDREVGRVFGAFLRKQNLYLLLPSVFPVDVRFRHFFVQRTVNFASLGIPAWVYTAGLHS